MWQWMICSSILHTTEVSETGLSFYVDMLLPLLKIATILAVLHNEGVVAVVSDVVHTFVKAIISTASSYIHHLYFSKRHHFKQ